MSRLPLILILATLVSACGGRGGQDVVRRDNDAFNSEPARTCLSTLKAADVRYTPLLNQSFGGGCHTIDTVKLMSFATEASNLGPMTCPLAANFTAWAKHAVRPAAKLYLGSDVVRIETMGTYNCRNVNGARSGRRSEHATGNAVDVSAFILKDGRRISVLNGWNGKADERATHGKTASARRRQVELQRRAAFFIGDGKGVRSQYGKRKTDRQGKFVLHGLNSIDCSWIADKAGRRDHTPTQGRRH